MLDDFNKKVINYSKRDMIKQMHAAFELLIFMAKLRKVWAGFVIC